MKFFLLKHSILKFSLLFSFAANAGETGWLYCMDERYPATMREYSENAMKMLTSWQWAKGENSDILKKYSPFVTIRSDGIQITVKETKKYSNFPELYKRFGNYYDPIYGNTWFEYERVDFKEQYKIGNGFFIVPLKEIPQNYAVVDFLFQSMDDAKTFCQDLQEKCGQDHEHLSAVGFGSRSSAWNGIRAETLDNGVNCDTRFPLPAFWELLKEIF